MSGAPSSYIVDLGGAKILVPDGRVRNGKRLHKALPCYVCRQFFISSTTIRVLINENFKDVCPNCIPPSPSVWLPNNK